VGGLVPADRFFDAASDVLRTLKERVAANTLELARHGAPKKPFYMTGQVGGQSFSVHSEGERVILRKETGEREVVDLEQAHELAAIHPPEQAEPLPEPVCPAGIVAS